MSRKDAKRPVGSNDKIIIICTEEQEKYIKECGCIACDDDVCDCAFCGCNCAYDEEEIEFRRFDVPDYKEDSITVSIKIPKEFVYDYKTDKFKDFFERVACDIKGGILCGNYEQETAEMLKKAFEESVKM